MAKITFVETATIPRWPHCEKRLTTIETHSKGFLFQRVISSCPHCHKLLSIGYDRLT